MPQFFQRAPKMHAEFKSIRLRQGPSNGIDVQKAFLHGSTGHRPVLVPRPDVQPLRTCAPKLPWWRGAFDRRGLDGGKFNAGVRRTDLDCPRTRVADSFGGPWSSGERNDLHSLAPKVERRSRWMRSHFGALPSTGDMPRLALPRPVPTPDPKGPVWASSRAVFRTRRWPKCRGIVADRRDAWWVRAFRRGGSRVGAGFADPISVEPAIRRRPAPGSDTVL
jgi:hypothetical protein